MVRGHDILTFDFRVDEVPRTEKKSILSYRKGNYIAINNFFFELSWNEIFNGYDAEVSYNKFLEKYRIAVDKWIPKIIFIPRKGSPWMTKEITKHSRLKKSLWYKYLASSKSIGTLHKYKNQCKLVKRIVNKTIVEYEDKICNLAKTNPKMFYSYVNKNKKVKASIRSMRDKNGEIHTDGLEIADLLNDQFKSVFVNEDTTNNLPIFPLRTDSTLEFDFENLSFFEIEKLLKCLDPNKSMGSDNVHPYVLKYCSKSLAVPLSLIFAKSIRESRVPSAWKDANVSPLFKSGSKLETINYRPISLTSIVSRIFEKILRNQVMNFLENNNLLNSSQHGFVRSKSCLTNLLETVDIITAGLNEGKNVDVVYMDYAKAFDKVPHKRLIYKVSKYGISPMICQWIADFLNGRRQRIILGDNISGWVPVKSGVPQESVLGPL